MDAAMDELKYIRENMPEKDCRMFGLLGYNVKYKKDKNRAMYVEENMQEQEVAGCMLKAFDTMSLSTRAYIIQSMIELVGDDMDVENEKQRRKKEEKKKDAKKSPNDKKSRKSKFNIFKGRGKKNSKTEQGAA